jgi:hypothetical protein
MAVFLQRAVSVAPAFTNTITRMKFKYLAMLAAALLVGPLQAFTQTPNIVGTWVLTAADKLRPDGSVPITVLRRVR